MFRRQQLKEDVSTPLVDAQGKPIEQPRRRIFLNTTPTGAYIKNQKPTQKFTSNKVRTSKYTFVTFLPRNIFEQFRGIANFYFLSLVVLQAFDLFKTVDLIVTALPIVIIVVATAIKDAIEDWKRHEADANENMARTYTLSGWKNLNYKESKTTVLKRVFMFVKQTLKLLTRGLGLLFKCLKSILSLCQRRIERESSLTTPTVYPPYIEENDYLDQQEPKETPKEQKWVLTPWQDVRVGDFVFLRNKDRIPADIIILSTSEPDSLCYIETKNLDGETNLKIRRGISELQHCKNPSDCAQIQGYVDTELPNNSLYTFNATLNLNQKDIWTQIPIGPNGVLLRGCVLRNTKWVIGLVASTGSETKIMLNSGETPSKRSRIDRQLNPHILLNFCFLACMCLICAMSGAIYNGSFFFQLAPYIGINPRDFSPSVISGIVTFFNCLIIFQNLIPIALYISLEFTKSAQSFLIHSDEDMYDPESEKSVEPKAWNLCDDLGQIEYIFTDKTGTLTSNTMEFRKASICGVSYGKIYQGPQAQDMQTEALKKMSQELKGLVDFSRISTHPSFVDPELAYHLAKGGHQGQKIREFFSLLSLCHTVLVDKPDKRAPNRSVYNAQSPDEAALVSAARDLGFEFTGRENNDIHVRVLGTDRTYRVLHIMEFNSDRKRMSVIIRRPEGELLLLTKGADSVIYERLSEDNDHTITERTLIHLAKYANEGLRTLCLAYRVVGEEEYREWEPKYREAQASITEREKKVDAIAELIERDLVLMGATAIEDRLQDGVPNAIRTLFRAGIKIWVLTGDKMETAINIGFSCHLLTRDMVLIVIKSTNRHETKTQLVEALTRFWNEQGKPIDGKNLALIIDGESLRHALDGENAGFLLELGCRCRAVICCRVSPLQKAMVVRLVKNGLGAMCLAIGDGANDVSMIREADIGIGINGKEGVQAVNASDYAIAQFRFLSKLLLVHGKWAYVRSAEMVLNYFYKNVVWLMILFWHQFYSGFNAGMVTDFTYSMFFNTVFTFFPTILIGIFDQDVNDKISQLVPQLYQKGIRQQMYGTNQFWEYFGYAVYQSLICYFVGYFQSFDSTFSSQGRESDLQFMGTTISFGAITVINLFSIFSWYNWTWITFASLFLSFALFIAYVLGYSSSADSPAYGIIPNLLWTPSFYAGVVLMVVLSLLPRPIFKYLQQQLQPTDTDIIQEIAKLHAKEDINQVFENRANQIHRTIGTVDHSHLSHYTEQSHVDAHDQSQAHTEQDVASSLENLQETKQLKPLEDKSMSRSKSDHKLHKERKKKPSNVPLHAEHPSTDGFGTEIRRRPKTLQEMNDEQKSRPPSSSSFGHAFKKAGDFVKRLTTKEPQTGRIHRGASLVYMGDNGGQVANTGFAFSHDTGMEDVITPMRTHLEPLKEEDESEPKKRPQSSASMRFRNISTRITSVLGLARPEGEQEDRLSRRLSALVHLPQLHRSHDQTSHTSLSSRRPDPPNADKPN
ncbi:hypothetical protein EDD86DRAFT_210177 [Gorgonomyces haynaldii]|nr:hypothetical protein EDD86DRAFT_210177 [Gorgonomyces haynaldii]